MIVLETVFSWQLNKYKNKKNIRFVGILQRLLRKNNYYLKCQIDGWFYTCIKQAVIAFKKKKGIKSYNSVVDKKVKKALLNIKQWNNLIIIMQQFICNLQHNINMLYIALINCF